jgi:hypothetical protein
MAADMFGLLFVLAVAAVINGQANCRFDEYQAQGGGPCVPCTVCASGQVMVSACTAVTDALCIDTSCPSNTFFTRSGKGINTTKICRPCTECSAPSVKVAECTGLSDTVCAIPLCPPNQPVPQSSFLQVIHVKNRTRARVCAPGGGGGVREKGRERKRI